MFATQAAFGCSDCAHQVVGIEAALDERPDFTGASERHGALRGDEGLVGRIDDRDARQIQARLGRGVGDAGFGSDEHGGQIAGELSGQCDLQGVAITGIDDRRRQRRKVPDPLDLPLEMRSRNEVTMRPAWQTPAVLSTLRR